MTYRYLKVSERRSLLDGSAICRGVVSTKLHFFTIHSSSPMYFKYVLVVILSKQFPRASILRHMLKMSTMQFVVDFYLRLLLAKFKTQIGHR